MVYSETCRDRLSSQVCVGDENGPVENPSGKLVLEEISRVIYVIESENNVTRDALVLVCCAFFFKVIYIIGVLMKSSQASKIHAN